MSLLDAQTKESAAPPPPGSPLKKLLPYTTVALAIASLYVAYVFYSRHQSDVKAQADIQAKQEAARKRVADMIFGNGEVKFTSFSIDTSSLQRGQTARLCYGVVNAVNVKLDPPVEKLKPTYQHCFDIAPRQTTKYTITADDGKGHSKSESLELKVQ